MRSAVALGFVAITCARYASPEAGEYTAPPRYEFMTLRSIDVTNTRGNSINNTGWVAGYSSLASNTARQAVAWFYGQRIELGTLGGPNSSVAWPVKNDAGLIVGIAQTATEDPTASAWSCSAFFPGPDRGRYTCLGFAWEAGVMRALPTLGGLNGYAAGANNRREIVGWAENGIEDTVTCAPPRTVQFRPVVWGPGDQEIRELPLVAGDTSGAATAINDDGLAVGISGTCDQAVGRYTARTPVLWDNGTVVPLETLGGDSWNTPTAVNRHGAMAGFASVAGTNPNNPQLRAVAWTSDGVITDLGTLYPHHNSALALGINDHGQIVGTSCPADPTQPCHAFLYENGVMKDLNAYRGPSVTYHLTRAQDINNDGAITGSAVQPPITGASQTLAFLATPNPGYDIVQPTALSEVTGPRGRGLVVRDQPHPLAPHPARHGG
jgi:probable HAF family extracellular repeat protein